MFVLSYCRKVYHIFIFLLAEEGQVKEPRGSVNNIQAALSAAAETDDTQKCLAEPKVKTKAGQIFAF